MKRFVQFTLLGLLLLLLVVGAALWWMTAMPGTPAKTARPPDEMSRLLTVALMADIDHLAIKIGERHIGKPDALDATATLIEARTRAMGYEPVRETFSVRGKAVSNIVIERTGVAAPDEILVVGAHYDTAEGTPGADDNGSGVAALLAIAEAFAARQTQKTLRLVFYVNEEPPFFRTDDMGSRHHAAGMQARNERAIGMLSLETLGYFSDAEGSQHYPVPMGPLYSTVGNYVGFVADLGSRGFLHEVIDRFRAHAALPSDGTALPASVPGVDWSDHASYARLGIPAVMVTDTAPFRAPHYHESTDLPSVIDGHRLALTVIALTQTIDDLVQRTP